MRRDIRPRIVTARNHRRSHQRNPPVLRLQLKRIHARPDGQHGLRRKPASNLREAKVKSESAREDLGGKLPRVLCHLLHVTVGVEGVGELVEERLQAADEGCGDLFSLLLVELRGAAAVAGCGWLLCEDCVYDCGLSIEKRLAECRGLALVDTGQLCTTNHKSVRRVRV